MRYISAFLLLTLGCASIPTEGTHTRGCTSHGVFAEHSGVCSIPTLELAVYLGQRYAARNFSQDAYLPSDYEVLERDNCWIIHFRGPRPYVAPSGIVIRVAKDTGVIESFLGA